MAENEKAGDAQEEPEAVQEGTAAVAEEGARAEDGALAGRRARKQRVGVVTSDRAEKTVTVTVERRKSHRLYGKQFRWTKRYHAHDEKNEYRVGDVVRIQETRPLSKTKRWRVTELIERPQ